MDVQNLIGVLILLAGIPSIISTIILFWFFFKKQQLQVLEFKLIVFMQVGDFCLTISGVAMSIWYFTIPAGQESPLYNTCVAIGVLQQFGILMSLTWLFHISFLLNNTINEPNFEYQKYWRVILVASLLIPFVLSVIPIISHSYGYVQQSMKQTNCYIYSGEDKIFPTIACFTCFLIPLWCVFGYSIYIDIKVVTYLLKTIDHPIIRKRVFHLFIYPLVLFGCWIWITFYIILNLCGYQSQFLEVTSYFFINFYGFLNSLVYGYNIRANKSDPHTSLLGSSDYQDNFTMFDNNSLRQLRQNHSKNTLTETLNLKNGDEELQISELNN